MTVKDLQAALDSIQTAVRNRTPPPPPPDPLITQNDLDGLVTTATAILADLKGVTPAPPATTTNGKPTVDALTPASGSAGTIITISGSGFGAKGVVSFNGMAGQPIAWSDTSIQVPVPAGATSGKVGVLVGSTMSNGVPFTVA